LCYSKLSRVAMTTTTLRLPPPLKSRIGKLAAATGQSVHAFLLEAVEEKVRDAETRAALVREAQRRFDETMVSGRGIDWHEMRDYLTRRARGERVAKPKARAWRKSS
jgi:predicted transcriptional regulator